MTYTIGQPVIDLYDNTGYICNISDDSNTWTIGAGGMQKNKHTLKIAFVDRPHFSEVSEHIAEPWIKKAEAYQIQPIDQDEIDQLIARVEAELAKERQQRQEASEKASKARAEFVNSIRDKVPAWSESVIIAEHHVSDSDPMTDYFGHHTDQVLILGFSKHNRDLFPELRKAAANAEETKHLAIKPEKPADASEYWHPDDEHREKYSMGGGYYLGVYRNNTGWIVSKRSIKGPDSIPSGRWCVPDKAKPAKVSRPVSDSVLNVPAHIEEHTHTKKGFLMYLVVMDQRVERDEYLELLDRAKAMRGWYSRKWGSTPGGFAFTEKEQAGAFLATLSDDRPDPDKPKGSKNQADKLRTMAEKLGPQIEAKFADRQTNTPKRLAQAMQQRLEGERLNRTQQALFKLADLHDSDEVPAILAGITSKKAVYDLLASKKEPVPNGYHSYYVETGEPQNTNPEALALWGLLSPKSEAEIKAQELQRKIEGLQFSKIPGFFPTPKLVIDLMINYANIQETDRILEPNLGSCALADAVAPLCAEVKGYEVNYTLAEIADAKDYLIERRDFLTVDPVEITSYEKILMNPPFENGQEMDHIRHAFDFLKPGGRLVSVVSPGPFYRSDKKSAAFRRWLDSLAFESVTLPDGSFKESDTGVSANLLIIDKE